MIRQTNALVVAVRGLVPDSVVTAELETLDADKTSAVFKQFDEFRSRNDHGKHSAKWFMGEDVSNLGPDTEPEPELKNEGEAEGETPQDDTFVFGGDYAGEEGRAVEQPEGGAQDNAVPTVSAADSADDKPEDTQDATAVP